MDHLAQYQKLCQLGTRRLILFMGVVFVGVLVFQSSTLPYGNVLLSLFPSGRSPLLQNNSSSSLGVENENDHTNDASINASLFDYSLQNDKNFRAPQPSLSEEHYRRSNSNISVDNAPNDGTRLTVEKVGSPITNIFSSSPALSPVRSFDNIALLKTDANPSVSAISVTPSMSPVGKQAIESQYLSPRGSVSPIQKLNSLLLQSRSSVHSMRPLWSSKCDHELLSAKLEIRNAPIINNDPKLHQSVFQNVSMFKRSYELMENLLKVYIYSEGEKPIFHEATEPILKGIYASEGWFIRNMEKNKHFVVKDPTKAHLFYLPFSSRMLQLQLYVRNSHSRKNLAEYMKNYVDMITSKYPFWNRTGGADHFLVACHDWAPFETRGHMDKCIKALCNANIGRDFILGKDLTLPTTQIRKMNDPLRGIGGNPPSERPILAFFAGGMHGSLRPILLKHWGNKYSDMKIYGQIPQGTKMNYTQHMKSSKYCVCPRGYDVNSPRVVEAIYYECVPVIIADDYVPPFLGILEWEAFAVFVPEKDVSKLREILVSISDEKYVEMHRRVKAVQKHFLWHNEPVKYDLFHMILHSVWFNRLNML
ncbi:hypothetical protein ACHQM5_002082 [Ranunculus cassubicifolius]